MITCSKTYHEIPFAHRQHLHDGHCSLIHGHNWSLRLTFGCQQLDQNGFVVDFGKLKYIKAWLDQHLDHACVLAVDDPLRETLTGSAPQAWRVYVAPNTSCEALAAHLYDVIGQLVADREGPRVWLTEVVLWEDTRNFATFTATP